MLIRHVMQTSNSKNIVKDGLVLWLDGKDFTNNPQTNPLLDRSGQGNNGTPGGFAYTTSSGSDENGGIVFDGVNDYLNCNMPLLNATEFTISFWINHNGYIPANRGAIIDQYKVRQSGRFLYWFNNGKLAIGGQYQSVEVDPPYTSDWYFTTITFKDSKLNVSFNNTNMITDFSFSPIYQGVNTKIGGVYDTYFNGSIHNVQIYNKALTQAEITQNYNATK